LVTYCKSARAAVCAVVGALAIVASVPSNAQIARAKDGWLFRVAMKPGRKVRFEMRAATEGLPTGRQETFSIFHLDFRSVQKDVATAWFGLERDNEGEYKDIHLTLKMNRLGKAMWGEQPMTRLGIVFPGRALKVGDTFPGEGIVSAGAFGKGTAKDTYRFVGFTEFDGLRVAKLEVTSGATLPKGRAAGKGIVLLDPRDGLMVRMIYTHEAELTLEGKTVAIKQTATAKRL